MRMSDGENKAITYLLTYLLLSTGSEVMRVQIWTNKYWTFQHVKDTLLNKNYDVITVVKYQFLWIFEELCWRSAFLHVL